jgi:uncharacterized protein YciI
MLFAIICHDRPGALQLRLDTRKAHLDHLERNKPMLVTVGPMLDGDGQPIGSLLLVEAEDHAAAQAFANADPYAQAGLFASVEVRPFRMVFKDGRRMA